MGRRCKTVTISSVMFRQIFSDGPRDYIVGNGLPKDARISNCQMAFTLDQVDFMIESDEFPEVPEGYPVPRLVITITEVIPEQAIAAKSW